MMMLRALLRICVIWRGWFVSPIDRKFRISLINNTLYDKRSVTDLKKTNLKKTKTDALEPYAIISIPEADAIQIPPHRLALAAVYGPNPAGLWFPDFGD
jgi:hypothetical protein